MKRTLPGIPLHQSQSDLTFTQGFFNIMTISVQQGSPDIGKFPDKGRQDGRQYILGNRRTGPQAQVATDIIGQQIHLEVQLPVSSQQRIGMRQQQFAGPGQHNTATGTVEQRRLILHLQFMNMLAYSRLTDIQFLRSLCKTQVSRYAIKYLQTKIHMPIIF